jgi:hypothetical protein
VTSQSKGNQSTTTGQGSIWTGRGANRVLWVFQGLLALLFLFAGSMKLIMPIAAMTKQTPFLPGPFFRFIGVAEVFGAIGLVLPWLLGIRRGLTPLAASGLVVIMAGATAVTLAIGAGAVAVVPFVVGVLLFIVAYGRWSSVKANFGAGKSVKFTASHLVSF